MAKRRRATVQIRVKQYVDDQVFTMYREMELPVRAAAFTENDQRRVWGLFSDAFRFAEREADAAWKKLGANNPKKFHTRDECTNPNCQIHPR